MVVLPPQQAAWISPTARASPSSSVWFTGGVSTVSVKNGEVVVVRSCSV